MRRGFEYSKPTVLHTGGMSRRTWAAYLAAGAAFATCATSAGAADPPAQRPDEIVARERPTTRSFYGWQILATGEAGGALAAAATILPDSPLKTFPSTLGFLVGMPLYALGGPATHWTHGSFEKGLISLAGNFALPVVSGLIGQSVRCSPDDAAADCGSRGFFTGFAIALVTVPIVDALVLGWEDLPDDDPPSVLGTATSQGAVASARRGRQRRVAAVTVAPAWNVGPRGELAFGVAGRF
jgi:hypothetical protein